MLCFAVLHTVAGHGAFRVAWRGAQLMFSEVRMGAVNLMVVDVIFVFMLLC